jgi:hypothetical protein
MSRDPKSLFYVGLLLALSACTDADAIRQYKVERTASSEPAAPPQEGVAWFFKLVGPKDAVEKLVPPFGELVRSVKFSSAGVPEWTLPGGWQERREEGLRFATLTTPGDPPVEATVIPLPHADPASQSYLRENINRWRGQLGLDPLEGDDWFEKAKASGEVAQVESQGRTLTIVNLLGKTSELGDARMLAAMIPNLGKASPPSAAPRRPPVASPAPSSSSLPFTYTLPEGWTQGAGSAFEMAVFLVGEGDDSLKISVSTAGGDLTANVNRWRGQVGLPSVDAAEIESSAKSITVGGESAQLFTLEGPQNSILGAIAPHAGATWFFKARGPKERAAAERDHFEAFLKSIAFKN